MFFRITWRIYQSETTLENERFKINPWKTSEKPLGITWRMYQSDIALENKRSEIKP
jgi:hypothetical protein